MTVTKRCIMIPVDELQPHPDNPRKDVGDVTELAESIKANGIFQNLTVLRNKDPETGKSTVIIGLMGYNISSAEKAMLDGTHECFKKKEEEN